MAAAINFFAGENFGINNLAGSGLGFYGSIFGQAVQIGSYQDTTYITNSNGTNQGPICDNVKFTATSSGNVNSVSGLNLKEIPNHLSTLNIRLTNDTSISTQNGKIYIYDRINKNNPPSGVTAKIAELVHPWTTVLPSGSGSSSWTTAAGSGSTLSLSNSPGRSGLIPGAATQHDWYIALSSSPDSIGSKTSFGLWIECEFL